MKHGGTIASIGLAASMSLNTTVAPFILRGACLLGIDSGYVGQPYRSGVWARLATDLKPRHLAAMTRTIAFADLPKVFDDFIQARAHGRIVVDIGA
jgi:threonine dehydrogenase-like Zn-dependent dehydrogenase